MHCRAVTLLTAGSLIVGACGTTDRPSLTATAIPTAPVASATAPPPAASPIAGGCGNTQVFAGPGPDAALGLSPNPWAATSPSASGITAYFWRQAPYIAAGPVNPDGGSNKILWMDDRDPQALDLVIAARPLGASSPVVRFRIPPGSGYPSTIDLPTPGCWHLDLAIGLRMAMMDLIVGPPPSS
jgi:hypothetical protein